MSAFRESVVSSFRPAAMLRAAALCTALTALNLGASPTVQAQASGGQDQAAMRAQAEAGMRQHYATRTAEHARDTAHRDIVMLGDSLIEGNNWQAAFPKVSLANRGIGGDTTEGMLRRLDTVQKLKPAKVFLMAGINDLSWYGRPVTEVFQQYSRLIDALGRGGARVYVQSTLKVGPLFPSQTNVAVAALNEQLRGYCNRGHCRYIDLNPILAPQGVLAQDYTYDQLHLTPAAYEKWVHAIRSAITSP